MAVGLDLNLSSRRTDLLRDLEKRTTFLIKEDTFVQTGSVLELLHPRRDKSRLTTQLKRDAGA